MTIRMFMFVLISYPLIERLVHILVTAIVTRIRKEVRN